MPISPVGYFLQRNIKLNCLFLNGGFHLLKPEDLIIGENYFLLSYLDESGLIPNIKTFTYIGKNLMKDKKDEDKWYFQDPESYKKYGIFLTIPKEDRYNALIITNKTIHVMSNSVDLAKNIMELNDLKKKYGNKLTQKEVTRTNKSYLRELNGYIREFILDESISLIIISASDLSFNISLSKEEKNINLCEYINCKTKSEEDIIRKYFAEMDLFPIEECFNNKENRTLKYNLGHNKMFIINTVKHFLTQIRKVTSKDKLIITFKEKGGIKDRLK
jgi:hypothetical protein